MYNDLVISNIILIFELLKQINIMRLEDLLTPNNMVLDQVFLAKFKQERPFALFVTGKTPDETIFCAVSDESEDEMYFYKYNKPFSEIEKNHKEDILNYTLGKHHEWENIYASDIFVHGEHVSEIDNPFQ